METSTSHPKLVLFLQILRTLGVIAGIVSLYVAIHEIKSNHDWNRRHYALEMMRTWNEATEPHKMALEKAYPGLYDDPPASDFSLEEARKIYNDSSRLDLQIHIVAMMNHLEYISQVYLKNVGDQDVIKESFKKTMIRWHRALKNWITVFVKHRGYNAWQPYVDLIIKWEQEESTTLEKRKTGF